MATTPSMLAQPYVKLSDTDESIIDISAATANGHATSFEKEALLSSQLRNGERTPSRDGKAEKAGHSAAEWMLTVVVVVAWYASNTGLLLLNKYVLSSYGFKRPVFLTLCHMLSCSAMSYGMELAHIFPSQQIRSKEQFQKIATLAAVFCLSVVLGNAAIRFIPLSFSQAIGATTPLFTAVLAAVMLKKREPVLVYSTLIPVVVGIVIATGAEPLFNMTGFVAAVAATAGRAFKSVLQGLLLTDSSEKVDSMNLLKYMAPIAAIALVPATAFLEPTVIREAITLGNHHQWFWAMLALNAFLAYFVNLTNFLITRYTSALTMQVLGNAKGVFTTVLSLIIFQNPFPVSSATGYTVTVVGVALYAGVKRYYHLRSTPQEQRSSTSLSRSPSLFA